MTKVSFGKIFGASLLANVVLWVIAGFFGLIFIIGIASMDSAGPKIKSGDILKLKLAGELNDQGPSPGLAEILEEPGIGKKMGLLDVVAGIRHAATDDDVSALYIEIFGLQTGMGALEEIRDAMIAFKESGKEIYVYAEGFRTGTYYLASAADHVYMYPEGMSNLTGLKGKMVFLEELFSNWGVDVEVVRHGSYKSAAETFVRNDLSEENKEQILAYYQAIWKEVAGAITTSREISMDAFNAIVERGFQLPQEMIDAGLVDSLVYENNLNETVKQAVGGDPNMYAFHNYVKGEWGSGGQEIALIHVNGAIPHGEGGGDQVPVIEVVKALNQARDNDHVAGVVMRVNSPGGSALFSDKIWRAAVECKAKKPLIVSMGDVAASGGYYVSAPADLIFVDQLTLTGSIGVFSMTANAKELLEDKWHLNFDSVMTHTGADIGTISRPMTDKEREVIQGTVDDIYDTFIGHVAEGRGMTKTAVDQIGGGRIWSGQAALDNGLADYEGGMYAALDSAAARAGVDEFSIVEYPENDPIKKALEELSQASRVMESLSLDGGIAQVQQRLTQWSTPQVRLPFIMLDW